MDEETIENIKYACGKSDWKLAHSLLDALSSEFFRGMMYCYVFEKLRNISIVQYLDRTNPAPERVETFVSLSRTSLAERKKIGCMDVAVFLN